MMGTGDALSPSDMPREERPVALVLTDLWEKAETLLRQEMKLGLTEAQERVDRLELELGDKVDALKRELAVKVLAGAVAFAGVLTLVAALILALSNALPPWLAALLVGAALSGGGYALLQRKPNLPDAPDANSLVPDTSLNSLKKDMQTFTETSS